MTKRQTIGLVAIAVCTVLGSNFKAVAVQLAYEPFNIGADPSMGQYAVGTLAGQNPTNSFFTGAWATRDATAPNAAIQATGLSYLGSPSSGGSEISTSNSAPLRTLATPWDATTTGTYYIGYEMSFGTGDYTPAPTGDGITGNDMGYRAVEFRAPDGTFQFGVGYNAYNGNAGSVNQDPRTGRMVLDNGPLQIIQGSPSSFIADNGTTHLIVLRFDLSATPASDTLSLYLDPTSLAEPLIANASLTGRDILLGTIGAATIYGGSGTFPAFDELRVGTTYADVLPKLPYPGDTDGNGTVDLVDYQHIFNHLGLTGQTALNGDVAKGDGTQGADGVVDLNDFHLWKLNYPHSPGAGAGSSAAVPEPTGLVLLIAGLVSVASANLARRRRKN
jgi:hypothetical protein